MPKGAMPVLVGVGQVTDHWDGTEGPEGAPSPNSLCVDASKLALADAGIDASEIDTLAVVRIFEDSVPGDRHPHGHNTNLPGTIARDIGAKPSRAIYAAVGGQSPQQLANEMAARIHAGEIECALVTGSEANKASKAARKHGVEIDWTDSDDLPIEDRGMGEMLLSRPEIKHGIIAPAYFYALFENAMAARDGQTRSQRRAEMSDLFAKFAAFAAANPYSQFDTSSFDAAFLATPSKANYPFADPFLKWHIAQDAVNQSGAFIIMSEDKADALGIAADKRVYLHGSGEAADDFISERPVLDGSWAMQTAIERALAQAGTNADEIAAFDLYSCFPCAVFSSMAVLGIDHKTNTRPLTLTGGLPFFGGPGNNYSMHGIVSMAEWLREHAGKRGLVLANGGWMTKEAVGIWSTTRPKAFTPVEPMAKPMDKVELVTDPGGGTVETYTVTYGKDGPMSGIIFGRTDTGGRFIAAAAPEAMPRLLEDESPVGLKVSVISADERNTFVFA
ncbi:MAG: acetyl-CoA acetyltransferase [Hyphomonadaceae bacterium]|nr:acetyl-CoA acetyltransferase [Hyphomonadaceae bacterium]